MVCTVIYFEWIVKEDKMFKSDNVFLHVIVWVVSSLTIMSGVAESWTSSTLPKLERNETRHHDLYRRPLSTPEISLVASLLQLGCAFGCIASIYTSPNIGKKKTIILFSTLSLTSYLLIGFGKNISYIYVARFLSGFGSSCCLTVVPQYINELIDSKKKQSPHSLMGIFLAIGILFSLIVGSFLDIREFSFICLVFIGLMLIIFNIWVPETPFYLASLGDKDKSERCLRKLRHNLDENSFKKELQDIFIKAEENKSSAAKFSTSYTLNMSLKPFFICVILLCFQELSGISIVLSYMQEIFAQTDQASPVIASIIIGGFKLLSAIIISSIMENVNKKNLLMISCAGSCCSLGVLGGYFYVKNNNLVALETVYWLPMVGFACYMFSFNTGFEHVAWAISTKVFQPKADLFASSIAHATSKFVAFSLTMSFPYVSRTIGLEFCFWTLCIFCLLSLVFVIALVRVDVSEEPSTLKTNRCEQTQVPP